MPHSIKSTLTEARNLLSATNPESAYLDAEVLLSFVLDKDRSYLHAWPENTLTEAEKNQFEQLAQRRASGEPVAHLTGQREFWSMMLKVSKDTLIPRPETEQLIELALELIPQNSAYQVADLGTGSGAIALAIARERPRCMITATDASQEALSIAQHNAKLQKISNVTFRQGNWCEALNDETCQMIVSNPPYIESSDEHLAIGDVRFEPQQALESGKDGLDAIRMITQQAHSHLEPGGWLILEHGYAQREDVLNILQQQGYVNLQAYDDLSGTPRICIGRTCHP